MLWRLLSKPAPAWLTATLYAHRGLHDGERIENGPAAFRAAIAAGLGVECDVQQSADGRAMVFHDWDLGGVTAASGPVRARTVAQLAEIPQLNGEPIWQLEQLLAEIAGRVPLLIEIKSNFEAPYRPLCRAVKTALAGYRGPVAIMSFDARVVRWFAWHARAVVRGWVTSENDGYAAGMRGLMWLWSGGQFLAYDVRYLSGRFVTARKASGVPILTWTVRDEASFARGREGADALIAEGEGMALARSSA